ELSDLATQKLIVLDSKGNGLTVQRLGPAEFLNEKSLKIKLSQTVAHVVHVDRHTSNNPLAVSKTKRANNAWFLGFLFLMNDTQPVCLSQLNHQLSEGFITDPTTKLAVQGVNSHLAQRIIVDILNSSAQLLAIEKRVFDNISVAHEPFIGTEAGPSGPP